MEYIPELTDKEIEEVHKHYEERLAVYRDKGLDFDKYRKFLLDKMSSFEGEVLELGTGTGYTTVTLAREGYKFTSIDTDEEALKTTAARLAYDNVLSNVKFYIMDATDLEFGNGSFDSVIAVNLVHHVQEAEKLLAEADRVLRPGGTVIISDFNEQGRKIIDLVHREEGRSHDHPVPDEKQIYSFFKNKGYKTSRFDSTGHWVVIARKVKD